MEATRTVLVGQNIPQDYKVQAVQAEKEGDPS